MSAVLATAEPRRIKATHRRRWKVTSGRFVYQHTDALGSPVAETSATGTVTKRNSYAPYGEAYGATSIDGTGYTGHVMDQGTGLTYMQQRYYDPQIGRFLSTDPMPADPNSGANFNSYWYANNNPFAFTDPDGRKAAGTPKPQPDDPCDIECKRAKQEKKNRERNSDMVIERGPKSNSSGFSIPGTEAGEEAAQQWADLQTQTGNDLYAIPGALASLWTPETAKDTALTLGGGVAGRPLAWAGNLAGKGFYASNLLGPAGSFLGRRSLGGSSFLQMNSRFSQLRFGWGWAGTAKSGSHVLRISGDWVRTMGIKSGHIDLWTSPLIVTP